MQFIFLILFCLVLIPDQTWPCSSFCLVKNGHIIVGANLDLNFGDGLIIVNRRDAHKRGWLPSTNGDYATWTSKYGSVIFSIAGREWVHYGMNEVGLVISTMALFGSRSAPPDERPPLSGNFWAQYLLDNFKTIDEVVASASLVRLENDADHYLVADRDGNCAVIECIDGRMVYYTNETIPVKVLTNTAYSETIERYKNNDIPDRDKHFSVWRFFQAANMLKSYQAEYGNLPVDYSFKILEGISNPYRTQWSIVLDITNLRVIFKTRRHRHTRYLDLNGIDFSFSPSLKMLDVNKPVSGDIKRYLKDYDRKINIDLMYGTFKKFGISMTREEVKEHILFLESFYKPHLIKEP